MKSILEHVCKLASAPKQKNDTQLTRFIFKCGYFVSKYAPDGNISIYLKMSSPFLQKHKQQKNRKIKVLKTIFGYLLNKEPKYLESITYIYLLCTSLTILIRKYD